MDILESRQLFSYLNCVNVSYRFHTERTQEWFMEITATVRCKNSATGFMTVDFCVSRNIINKNEHNFDLYVREPSGLNLLFEDVAFDVAGYSLIEKISEYLIKLAKFVQPSGNLIVVKETEVVEGKHNQTYIDEFLNILHASGFIETDYIEQLIGETRVVTVFIRHSIT